MPEPRSTLRPYWFEFELPYGIDCPRGTREGVGVTALDRQDAIDLMARVVFNGRVPTIRMLIEDVGFHRLCPWLVLPTMTDPRPRGVWFPARAHHKRR